MNKVFTPVIRHVLLCLTFATLLCSNLTAQQLYLETFDTNGEGIAGNCGATIGSCATNVPASNGQWSIVGNPSGMDNSDDFLMTDGGELHAQDTESDICFRTSPINISGKSVNFSLNLRETGSHENDDYVDVTYIVDGNPTLITNYGGLGNGSHTLVDDYGSTVVTQDQITGNTLVIEVCIYNSSGSEDTYLDNILVVSNQDLMATCPLKAVLVLDESGSIESSGATSAVKAGAQAFVDALTASTTPGLESQLAVVEFNFTANNVNIGGNGSGFQQVDAGGVYSGNFASYLNTGYTPNSLTNWEDAFQKILDLNMVADYVIFFTDGNPTALNNGNCNPNCNPTSSFSAFDELTQAIQKADQVKALGTHIFVLGVGNVSAANLRQISGPDIDLGPGGPPPANDPPIEQADYTLVPISDIQQCLEDIPKDLCGTELTINKQISELMPCENQQVTFTIDITDVTDGLLAKNVELTDEIMSGYNFINSVPAPSSVMGNTYTWNLGDLSDGASTSVTITVSVNAEPNDHSNTAAAEAGNAIQVTSSILDSDVNVTQTLELTCPPPLDLVCGENYTTAISNWIASATTTPNAPVTTNPGTVQAIINSLVPGQSFNVDFSATSVCGNDDCVGVINVPVCCMFQVACPNNLDLGDFDCTSLANIPAQPNTLAELQAAPYNITIGNMPCGNLEFTVVDSGSPDICSDQTQTITRTITIWDDLAPFNGTLDQNEDSETCIFSFDIIPDTQGPSFDMQPAAISDINCNDPLPVQETLTATDDCSSTVQVTPSVDNYTEDVCNGYMVTYRWTATDDCNNSTVVTKSFNVLPDTQGPTFDSQPSPISNINCSDPLPTQEVLTAMDNCGTATVTPSVDNYTEDQCNGYSVTYRWVATDDCSNSTVVTKTFNVLPDIQGPTFDNPPADIADISCSDPLPVQETLTAMDNCGTATVTPSVDNYTADQCNGYSVTYRWVATDDCSNSTVVTKTFNVLPDMQGPTFDNPPANIADISCSDPLPMQETLTASDDCSNTVVVVPSVDNYTEDQCNGYMVTYRWVATDDCSNSTVVTKTFNVLPDMQGPTFDNPPANIADISCSDPLPMQETLTASDDCSNTVVVVPSVDNYTEDQCNGYMVTYRWVATDDCSNSTVVTKSFNVLPDMQGPAFDIQPADIADIACSDPLPMQETLTASDDCSNTVVVTPSVDNYTPDQCNGYMVTYRWTATDDCNNSTVVTKSFNVLPDNQAPTFDMQPATLTNINCGDPFPMQETLTASDNCGNASVTPSIDPYTVDQCAGYTVTYRWTATDACNNSAIVTRSFNVLPDGTPPSITCPADLTVSCEDSTDPSNTGYATCGSDCGGGGGPDPQNNCPANIRPTHSGNITPDGMYSDWNLTNDFFADMYRAGNPNKPVESKLYVRYDCATETMCVLVLTVDGVTALMQPDDAFVKLGNSNKLIDGNEPGFAWVYDGNDLVGFEACMTLAPGTYSNLNVHLQVDDGGSQTSAVADRAIPICLEECEMNNPNDPNDPNGPMPTYTDVIEPGNCPYNYVIVRTWTCTDACNNSASCTQRITVQDITPPTVQCPANTTVECGMDTSPAALGMATGSDNCGMVTVGHSDSFDPACGNTGIIMRTWTVTDECNNTNSCVQTITIQDNTAPTFDNQPNPISDINCSDPLPTQETLTASDNCGNASVNPSVDPYTPDQCNGYQVTYRWVATDACNNTTVVTQSFNVLPDTQGPTFDAQPDPLSDIDCNDPFPTQQTLTASDDCSNTVVVTPSVDPYTPDQCNGYQITYRWVASDDCNNTTVVTRSFNVLPDTEPPMLDTPDPISDISCSDPLPAQQFLNGTDNCSSFSIVPSVDPYTPDVCNGYTVTYRWTATDACGNSAVVTRSFNVLGDNDPPVLDTPDPISDISCNEPLPTQQVISASDNCNAIVIVPSVDPYTEDVCNGYSVTYRWTATDACGNSAVVTRSFNVLGDNDPPVLDTPDPISDISCNEPLPTQQVISASDNCNAIVIVPSVDPFTPDVCNGYTVTYRWTATDACNNSSVVTRSFNVLPDTEPPMLDTPDPLADISCSDPFPTQQTLNGTDNCNSFSIVPSVDPYTPDQCNGYTVTYRWTATDACNNSSVVTQSFNVLPDTQGPTFDAQPGPLSDIDCNDPFPVQQTLTASDDCSSTVQVTPSVDPYTPDQCNGYQVTYRWVATDDCNNTTVVTQSFNVLPDTQGPVFDMQPDPLADINCYDPFPMQQRLMATDDCSSTVRITPSIDPYTPDQCNGYTVTYRWVASDDCNNTSVVTQSFNVLPDTQSPTFDVQPMPISDIDCDTPLPTQQVLTASDDCSNTVQVTPSVDPYQVDVCNGYSVTYRWVASDDCNNTSVVTRTFNVRPDTDAPVFNMQPAPLGSISCDDPLPPQQTLTASDDCSGVTVTPSVDPYQVDVCNGYTVTYRWVATDGCGNSSAVTSVLTVLPDTDPPSFNFQPSLLLDIACDDPFPAQQTLTASDDCSAVTVTPSVDPYTVDVCGGYAVTYRWVASDACGNSAVVTRTFNVLPDSDAPDFNFQPNPIGDISCNAPLPPQQTLTATDDCSGVTVVPSVDPYTVDICNGYAVTYRWVATDDCGNSSATTSTFNVLPDMDAPIFDMQPSSIQDISCSDDFPAQQILTASDDCSTVTVTPSVDPYTVDICNGYAVTYRWTATDACGNGTSIIRTFNVLPDTEAPVFNSLPNTIADINCDDELPVQQTLTASDDCSTVTVTPSVDPYTVDICNGYSITYRWTATDACGNGTSVAQTFNVLPDTDAPTFDDAPPSAVTISCDEPLPAFEELTASDNCSAVTVTSSIDPYEVDVCDGYTVVYRWTATDACGNATSTTQTITVLPDTEAPELTPVHPDLANIPQGSEVFVQCNSSDPNWNPFVFSADDMQADDDCSSVEVTLVDDLIESSDNCAADGFLSRYRCIWTATDACGNTSEFWFIMTIVDNTRPNLIGVPANTSASCHAIPPAPTVTATDGCGPATVSFSETSSNNGACAGEYTIYRTWTAVDGCGNTRSATQTISVYDNTAPILNFANEELLGYESGDEITIECGIDSPFEFDITDAVAIDFCDGNPHMTHDLELIESNDCAAAGYVYTIKSTWTATDDCGNSSELVLYVRNVDTTPPTLVGVPDAVCSGSIPPAANVTATDNCSAATVTMTESLPQPCADGGTYIVRTWTAIDECGNEASASQVIITSDSEGPSISITNPLYDGAVNGGTWTVEADCSEEYGLAPLTADDILTSDNCYEGATIDIVQELVAEGDCAVDGYLYQVQLKVQATDFCGNTSTFELLVNVVDSNAPVFGDNETDITEECGAEAIEPEVSDACTAVVLTYEDTAIPADLCDGTASIQRTWTATDACGNTSTFVQTVYILDTTGPVLLGVPEDECGTPGVVPTVTAVDNCSDANIDVIFEESIEGSPCGDIIARTWTAYDACGNETSETQYIIDNDNEAPVITFDHPLLDGAVNGERITVACSDAGYPLDIPGLDETAIMAEDDCSHSVDVQFDLGLLDEGNCWQNGYLALYRALWTATDACGNETMIHVMIMVTDDVAPALAGVPDNTVAYCNEIPDAPEVIALDNCVEVNVVLTESYSDGALVRTWTATDACGNTASASQHIQLIDNISACSFSSTEVIYCSTEGNELTVTPQGGSAPYSYSWEIVSGSGYIQAGENEATVVFASGISDLVFEVTVTDANGCVATCTYVSECIKIEDDNPIEFFNDSGNDNDVVRSNNLGGIDDEISLKLYPNPAKEELFVEFESLKQTEKGTILIYDVYGSLIYSEKIETFLHTPYRFGLKNYPAGVYTLFVKYDDYKSKGHRFIIAE